MTAWMKIFLSQCDQLGVLAVERTEEYLRDFLGGSKSNAAYWERQILYVAPIKKEALFHELGHAIDDLIDRRATMDVSNVRDDELRAWGIGLRIMRKHKLKIDWLYVRECLNTYLE